MSITTILIIILILLLIAIPSWRHSRSWGYGPSGVLERPGHRDHSGVDGDHQVLAFRPGRAGSLPTQAARRPSFACSRT
jgi:hypothetical protein